MENNELNLYDTIYNTDLLSFKINDKFDYAKIAKFLDLEKK